MKSFDHSDDKAVQLLNGLYTQLNKDGSPDLLDEGLDKALHELEIDDSKPFSESFFHAVLTDFMIAVYKTALPLKRKLTREQALGESIALLERTYRGTYKDGYDGALQDAADSPMGGIHEVLIKMRDAMKSLENEKHLRRLVAQYIVPADWDLKCRISEILLDRLKRFFIHEITSAPAFYWADQIVDLLLIDQETTQLLANPPSPFNRS